MFPETRSYCIGVAGPEDKASLEVTEPSLPLTVPGIKAHPCTQQPLGSQAAALPLAPALLLLLRPPGGYTSLLASAVRDTLLP